MKQHYNIQYHNADNLGHFPYFKTNFKTSIDLLTLDNTVKYRSQFFTKKKLVEKAIGQYCFLIVGKTEKIKKYYLWSFFKIEDYVKDSNGFYPHVNGTGYDFKKPILLNELEHFNDFKNFCGNFGFGFQNIDNHKFCKTLVDLSSQQSIDTSNIVEENTEEDLYLALQQLNEKMKNIEPEKRFAEIEQTLRKDKKIVELLKKSANYKCQFPNCESEILTRKGTNYFEVAHIQPIHKSGKSILGNLIVLCPNHHKEFDYGTLYIDEQTDIVLTGILNGKTFTIDLKKKLRPK